MKKYVLLLLAAVTVLGCTSMKKSAYKSVDQRNVPERYVKDFQRNRPEVKDVRWEMADSNTYFANFKSMDNDCIMKFTRTRVDTYYLVPTEYAPSNITDFIQEKYPESKINRVYILDSRNLKTYRADIQNKNDKKVLEFDLNGNFNKEIENDN